MYVVYLSYVRYDNAWKILFRSKTKGGVRGVFQYLFIWIVVLRLRFWLVAWPDQESNQNEQALFPSASDANCERYLVGLLLPPSRSQISPSYIPPRHKEGVDVLREILFCFPLHLQSRSQSVIENVYKEWRFEESSTCTTSTRSGTKVEHAKSEIAIMDGFDEPWTWNGSFMNLLSTDRGVCSKSWNE